MAAYLLGAALSIAAFWLGRALGRRGRAAAAVSATLLLSLLGFKAALNLRPDWEYALFPHPAWSLVQGWLIYPVALASLGMASVLLPPGRNRRAITVLAVFVFPVSLWTERWMATAPDDSSTARAGPDHHCPQSTSWSCGPAACVSLLSHLGVAATEGEMVRLCRTPPHGGTSLFRISMGLRSRLPGSEVLVIDGDPDDLRRRGGPAIVSVHRVHAIAVAFDGDDVIVHDPSRPAPERMPFEEYRKRYDGFAVVVNR
jgi:hypothetical protein